MNWIILEKLAIMYNYYYIKQLIKYIITVNRKTLLLTNYYTNYLNN